MSCGCGSGRWISKGEIIQGEDEDLKEGGGRGGAIEAIPEIVEHLH